MLTVSYAGWCVSRQCAPACQLLDWQLMLLMCLDFAAPALQQQYKKYDLTLMAMQLSLFGCVLAFNGNGPPLVLPVCGF